MSLAEAERVIKYKSLYNPKYIEEAILFLTKQGKEIDLKTGKQRLYQFTASGILINMITDLKEFCQNNEYNENRIKACVEGKLKSAYGFRWPDNPKLKD